MIKVVVNVIQITVVHLARRCFTVHHAKQVTQMLMVLVWLSVMHLAVINMVESLDVNH